MRRVPASRKNQRLRPSNAALNGFNLGYGAIFIVFALNDQGGAGNRAKESFNVPLAKLRIEPNIIPSAKHFVDMLVITRQFFTQVSGVIDFANRNGASQTELFDENVRRLQDESANFFGPSAGVDQSDRAARVRRVMCSPWTDNLRLSRWVRSRHLSFLG